ncbi:MAG: glycosyltransferase [Novosphingobium sp.]|nr:glycosyltransferase [Novosphingobium sp.]
MLKIYDCSNTIERPTHRKISYCPVENTIVSDLKKYASDFNALWVSDINKADVLFTNDVFPSNVLLSTIRKVKRMDGIFQLNSLKERNEKLNYSAQIADDVIFVSEFSKQSYIKLYGDNLKNTNVVLNTVDEKVFFNTGLETDDLIFSASCSNWERPEKRFSSLMDLAEYMPNIVHLIGNCPFKVPKNVIKWGYIRDDQKINEILNMSNAFINVSYKDACPKTVSQAVACGLPVLYANSGGVPEQVKYGMDFYEKGLIGFEDNIPKLEFDRISIAYIMFIQHFKRLRYCALKNKITHLDTLSKYYDILKKERK